MRAFGNRWFSHLSILYCTLEIGILFLNIYLNNTFQEDCWTRLLSKTHAMGKTNQKWCPRGHPLKAEVTCKELGIYYFGEERSLSRYNQRTYGKVNGCKATQRQVPLGSKVLAMKRFLTVSTETASLDATYAPGNAIPYAFFAIKKVSIKNKQKNPHKDPFIIDFCS